MMGNRTWSVCPRTGKRPLLIWRRRSRGKLAAPQLSLKPMTLEGCVVRLADTISYIGRDLEDAITLNLVQREELPAPVTQRLGRTNGAIVYSLVADLITHSFEKNYVGYSPEVGQALKNLKAFNYERIYRQSPDQGGNP